VTRTDIIRFIRLIRRRRWLIAAVSLFCLSIIVVGALMMPVYYRASVVLMPSDAALRSPWGAGTVTGDSGRLDSGQRDSSQKVFMELAQSPEVLHQASQDLNLKMSPEQLEKLLLIQPAFGAQFSITAFATTGNEAINMANGVAKSLEDYYAKYVGESAELRLLGLKQRVDRMEMKMQEAANKVSDLRSKRVSMPATQMQNNPLISRDQALRDEADNLRTQLSALAEQRRQTETQLRRQPASVVAVSSTSDTPLAISLRGELSRLNSELAEARSRYTDKNLEVIRLQNQIKDAEKRLAAEMTKMDSHKTVSPNPLRNTLENSLVTISIEESGLSSQMTAINALIEQNRGDMRASTDNGVKMAAWQADYEAANDQYKRYSGEYNAAKIEYDSLGGKPELGTLQPARVAEGPAPRKGPDRVQLIILGVLLSLVLGIGAALAAEGMDVSLKTAEEVQEVLQLPLSARIPQVLGAERQSLPMITKALPVSPYAECYRFLRTSILSEGLRRNLRVFMMTAASPGQGSTTTSTNLALSFAEAGKRIVLVDADLRRPKQHGIFNLPNDCGLLEVFTGAAKLDDALQPTDAPGLYLLAAGGQADNPSALLNSERMREIVEDLRQRFDYVLLDAPPVLAFSDSAVLSALVDGVLLVVRVGDSSRGNEVQAKIALEKAGARIMGVVVNGLAAQQIDSFHYHSHYYGQAALPARNTYNSVDGEAPQ
jgi:polysaccharide biosynthesis transport protein